MPNSVTLTSQDDATHYEIDIAQTGPATASFVLKEYSIGSSADSPPISDSLISIVAAPNLISAKLQMFLFVIIDIQISWTTTGMTVTGGGQTKTVPLTPQGYGDLEAFLAAAAFPSN